jgi:hypothetical protein
VLKTTIIYKFPHLIAKTVPLMNSKNCIKTERKKKKKTLSINNHLCHIIIIHDSPTHRLQAYAHYNHHHYYWFSFHNHFIIVLSHFPFLIPRTMDKQKLTLLDAYVKKIIALSKLQIIDNKNKVDDNETSVSLEEFDSIYTDVGKFTDYTDTKVIFSFFFFPLWNHHN